MKYIVLIPYLDYDYCDSIEYYFTESEEKAKELAKASGGIYKLLEEKPIPLIYKYYSGGFDLVTKEISLHECYSISEPKEKLPILSVGDDGRINTFYFLQGTDKQKLIEACDQLYEEEKDNIIHIDIKIEDTQIHTYYYKPYLEKNNWIINIYGYTSDVKNNKILSIPPKNSVSGVLPNE